MYVVNCFYEPYIHDAIEANHIRYKNNPKRIAINLGGHIGRYAIELANAYGYNVLVFEPNPKTFNILDANIALSDARSKVTSFPFGLGDMTGKTSFFNDFDGD